MSSGPNMIRRNFAPPEDTGGVATETRDRFDAYRLAEEARFKEATRRSRIFIITLLPLGAALAAIFQYLALIDLLDNADYRYQLTRPGMDVYLRLVFPAVIAGFLATTIVAGAFTFLAEAAESVWRLLTVGFFYGMLMPLLLGVFMPINLFVLEITDLTRVTNQGALEDQIGDLIFGIPGSVYLSWVLDTGSGMIAGLLMAVLAFAIFHLAGPLSKPGRGPAISLAGLGTGVGILFLVVAGPFSILEFLFERYSSG
jgi:hypothetical protein